MAYYLAVVKKRGAQGPLKVTFNSGKGEEPLVGETMGAIIEMCKAAGVQDTADLDDFQLMAIKPGHPQFYSLVAEKPMPRGGVVGKEVEVSPDDYPDVEESKALVPVANVSTEEREYITYERIAA